MATGASTSCSSPWSPRAGSTWAGSTPTPSNPRPAPTPTPWQTSGAATRWASCSSGRRRDRDRAAGSSMRIAIFGSGWVTPFHAQGIVDHPSGELVAATNWREKSLARLAELFGIPRTTIRWEDLLADRSIDAVVIATPNALHAPQAIACLQAGKHVLVEKPMATSVAQAEGMIAAAGQSGPFLMVAHCW